jgi:hypothetical protein
VEYTSDFMEMVVNTHKGNKTTSEGSFRCTIKIQEIGGLIQNLEMMSSRSDESGMANRFLLRFGCT